MFLQQLCTGLIYTNCLYFIQNFYPYFDKLDTLDINAVELKCLVRTTLVQKGVWYKLGHRNILVRL